MHTPVTRASDWSTSITHSFAGVSFDQVLDLTAVQVVYLFFFLLF